ncbi:DUF4192 domain-containing protein [Nocardioides donggukensis]|uniref:DUF4192 domain-containing protein n=1 Tax=Nocardioides donggukensis TaxID=2774019 RepID=A0A927K8M2_9ACTN|nr:DUF4192 domain-containing protein [Nocardioides donggukensis]MBD8869665.1 DUF4192 domain-containing protein [Nocardioides donggukensis]
MATPHTLTARTPEDLLAAVPCVLGFRPEDSMVMLTFGPGAGFHARVDLPDGPEQVALVVEPLRAAACRNGVRRVVLIAYTGDAELARTVCDALAGGLEEAGVRVLEMLRCEGELWFPLTEGHPEPAYAGVRHDVTSHRFAVESVVRGRVTHASRADLAASLRGTDAGRRADVATAARRRRPGGSDPSRRRAAEARWVRDTLCEAVADGTTLAPADAGRLLVALQDRDTRNLAWSTITPATCTGHVDLWSELVRCSPEDLVAEPAALLGFAAWLAGSGALAWCALDRALAVEPDHALAADVGMLLENAVPPSAWERPRVGGSGAAPDGEE